MKPFQWLRGGPEIAFLSPLTPTQFAKVFVTRVGMPHPIPTGGHFGSTDILGKMTSDSTFVLQERCIFRKPGMPIFEARVSEQYGGSRIEGCFFLPALTILGVFITIVALLSVSLMSAMIGCIVIAESLYTGAALVFVAIMFLILSVTSLFLLRCVSSSQEERYVNFICSVFKAKVIHRLQ